MKQKTCIIICGPTASGKTDFAIDIAKHFHTQIISADSRQCFTELGIGVAKPLLEQLSAVQHYFINSHSITENISAADFEQYALESLTEIFKANDLAVMVGGTGLYIKAFCEGLDDIAQTDPKIKNDIIEKYTAHGIIWIQEKIKTEDPLYFEKGEIQNPQRMMRALEVIRNTGKSIIAHQQKIKKERDFKIIKIGIDIPRPILYERINTRVNKMMAQGLEKEAETLHAQKELNALQTVGYRELFDYFENKNTLEKAIELIKQNTRHYAKRQLTWFKKDEDVIWLTPEKIFEFVKNKCRLIA
jgi:tRNA dimethylallyltransferase